MTLTNHQKGILLAFAGVMLLTPDSLLIRLITIDTWSLLFYRSLIPTISSLVILFHFTLGVFLASKKFDLTLLFRSPPFYAIIISVLFLYFDIETPVFLINTTMMLTYAAIFLCLAAVVFIFYDSIGTGRILGDIFGILTALAVASSLVVIRAAGAQKNFVPSYVMGKIFTALIASTLLTSFAISSLDLSYIFLMIFTVAVSFIFIMFAPRFISAPEVGLFFLLETALGPIWVWWV